MLFALETLRVQLVVFSFELEGYIALLFVCDHQIQVLATSAADESGFARIESQNIHIKADILMRNPAAKLPISPPPIRSCGSCGGPDENPRVVLRCCAKAD
jgi:hypothetical protein